MKVDEGQVVQLGEHSQSVVLYTNEQEILWYIVVTSQVKFYWKKKLVGNIGGYITNSQTPILVVFFLSFSDIELTPSYKHSQPLLPVSYMTHHQSGFFLYKWGAEITFYNIR